MKSLKTFKQILRRAKSQKITVHVSLISYNNAKTTMMLFFGFATYMKTTKQSHFVRSTISKYLEINFCDITCREQKLICKTELFHRDRSWKIRNQRKAGDKLTMWASGSDCCLSAVQQHKPYRDIPPPPERRHGTEEDCTLSTPQRTKDRLQLAHYHPLHEEIFGFVFFFPQQNLHWIHPCEFEYLVDLV